MTPLLSDWLPMLFAWQEFEFEQRNDPSPAELILTLACSLVVLSLFIALAAFISYVLSLCLQRIPPQFRQMEPNMTYLLLIPCFNIYWNFEVFQKIPRSYQAYFHSIGRHDVGDCGQQLGLWGAILVACGLIPCIGGFFSMPGGIILLVLVIKLWGYRNQIPETAA